MSDHDESQSIHPDHITQGVCDDELPDALPLTELGSGSRAAAEARKFASNPNLLHSSSGILGSENGSLTPSSSSAGSGSGTPLSNSSSCIASNEDLVLGATTTTALAGQPSHRKLATNEITGAIAAGLSGRGSEGALLESGGSGSRSVLAAQQQHRQQLQRQTPGSLAPVRPPSSRITASTTTDRRRASLATGPSSTAGARRYSSTHELMQKPPPTKQNGSSLRLATVKKTARPLANSSHVLGGGGVDPASPMRAAGSYLSDIDAALLDAERSLRTQRTTGAGASLPPLLGGATVTSGAPRRLNGLTPNTNEGMPPPGAATGSSNDLTARLSHPTEAFKARMDAINTRKLRFIQESTQQQLQQQSNGAAIAPAATTTSKATEVTARLYPAAASVHRPSLASAAAPSQPTRPSRPLPGTDNATKKKSPRKRAGGMEFFEVAGTEPGLPEAPKAVAPPKARVGGYAGDLPLRDGQLHTVKAASMGNLMLLK
ncbi:hypothetical protein BC828DRAFT_377051 [Blastocladiella britannica]|nr:hypothetical protein BC828DRAFT_377051 [Blastocladiella britannica]